MNNLKQSSKLALILAAVITVAIFGLTAIGGGSLPVLGNLSQDSYAQTDVLTAYENAMAMVYADSLPSIVDIEVTQKFDADSMSPFGNMPHPTPDSDKDNDGNSPFEMPEIPEDFRLQGQGSGFVWDKDGHIVTNFHVIDNAEEVYVTFANGNSVEATVIGGDPDSDLAVIKVDLPASDLQPLSLGDSDALQVGQIVIAIGNPFGQDFTMTSGIVSAVGRTIRSGNSQFSIPEVIQTDASINPGNSGGPLLTRFGDVIGINTQILSRSGSNAGVGFAVPINIAKNVVPALIDGESYQYAWLGISGQDFTRELAEELDFPAGTRGALVMELANNGPAEQGGLRGSDDTKVINGFDFPIGGDVIIAINDTPVSAMDDLITYLVDESRPGDEVTLTVIHADGEEDTVSVTLGARPTDR